MNSHLGVTPKPDRRLNIHLLDVAIGDELACVEDLAAIGTQGLPGGGAGLVRQASELTENLPASELHLPVGRDGHVHDIPLIFGVAVDNVGHLGAEGRRGD